MAASPRAGVWHIASLTREEVRALAPDSTLLLPTAAIEQHGPHLPLVTDTLIANEVTQRAASTAGETVPILISPTATFGSSQHHLVFTALSLRSTTFQAVITDLLDSAIGAGFKRIFILNAHGGNDEAIRLAARDVVLRAEVAIAANSYWTIAQEGIASVWGNLSFPGHAGAFETSLMLALDPDLVRHDLRPVDEDHATALGNQNLFRGWAAQHGDWLRIDGYSDAPIVASSTKGHDVLQAIVDKIADAIVAFHNAAGITSTE